MSDKPLKILIVGCGSIGRRHIRLLKEMGATPIGCDTNKQAAWNCLQEYECPVFGGEGSLQSALNAPEHLKPDGAIIATPNHLHREPAMECIWNGLSVLVEKPLAHNIYDAVRIANAADLYGEEKQSKLLVGYCLRFHPGLRRMKELIDSGAIGTVRHASIHFGSYLPDWRPGTDYRTGYAASRAQGGGILMDASHELDYACWLLGRSVSVSCVMHNSGVLQIETEDIADLVLRFESGSQASIHLDYLSREPRRGCVIIGDKGSIVLDFPMDRPIVYLAERSKMEQDVELAWHHPKPFDPDDMYRAELQHFLACIRGEEKPLVTGEDGLRAVRVVEAARKSSDTGRVVNI